MQISEDDKNYLLLNGYEYLDGRFCYAKVGCNYSIKTSCDGNWYVNIHTSTYRRGFDFSTDKSIFIGYFNKPQELVSILTILEKYRIY